MFISANGLNFNVSVEGSGPTILLLHGFPDSSKLWRHMVKPLVSAGYRVIALDQRGFGESDAPPEESDYVLEKIVSDAILILQKLGITEKVYLVGHDWGALIGWQLCIQRPDLIEKYAALSVGHPMAFRRAGWQQRLKSWYVLAFQLRGIAETQLRSDDWKAFRKMAKGYPELANWIADLERPGRLTAALNWYRANFRVFLSRKFGRSAVPTMGIYSAGDLALTEKQMVDSAKYMDAEWKYLRIERSSHWIPLEQPELLTKHLLDWFSRTR